MRKGPNKVIIFGVLQPFVDGIKLFIKENYSNFNSNKYLFNLFPVFSLFNIIILWFVYKFEIIEFIIFRVIYFIIISRISVYWIIGRGWVSNSKYALLGAYRSMAQVISYEVGIVFIIITLIIITINYNFNKFISINDKGIYLCFGFILFFFVWLVIILAELNRAPFDFAERERELVSGFNVEYGSLKFAFLFLAEYGNIILIAYVTILMFFNEWFIWIIFIIIYIVWVRGTFPRFRYDILIYLNWKIYLPIILMIFVILYSIMFIYI